MTVDPLVLMIEVDRATGRLVNTASGLDDAAVGAPSLLPGWTRGHVLTHLARNADAINNVLTGAGAGESRPAYPSREARDADIEAGAARPAATQLADLRDAATRLARTVAELPADAWSFTISPPSGTPRPAAALAWGRLREVELHHVDLDAGYTPKDWPAAFSQRLLREVALAMADNPEASPLVVRPDDGPHEFIIGEAPTAPVITGPAWALATYLAGRGRDEVGITPDGPLPTPPQWL